jgi:nitrile hydratase accessory protein
MRGVLVLTHASRFTHERQSAMPLPRDNGELMFHSPWESRVFAMAVLLCEKGEYAWNTFNEQFAKCIGDAEMHYPDQEAVAAYYHHWRQALETVLLEKAFLLEEPLQARTNEFATGQRHHVG